MLANYFPMPTNQVMGTWALAQAQAIRRQGADVLVIALTSWVPDSLAITNGARRYARCPDSFDWDGLSVEYPRWLSYSVGPLRRIGLRNPRPLLSIGWWSAAQNLLRKVSTYKPDVVYAHHSGTNGYVAWRLTQETGLPYVVTDHEFGEITACSDFPARRKLFQDVMGSAYQCIAVTSRMEQDIRERFPGARTLTIWNGSDPIPEEIKSAPRPSALAGRRVVFSCGHFYERKGFPLLVRAFGQVAKEFPDALLRIAGDGPERGSIEAEIRAQGLEERVQLLGFVPNLQVRREMCWCDVFALIGWLEPFGVVFAEAFSAGKPVICSRDAGFTDVLEDGRTGFAVPPKDEFAAVQALRRLLKDRALRERMGHDAACCFDSKLRWDHNAAAMVRVFEEAAAERRAGRRVVGRG